MQPSPHDLVFFVSPVAGRLVSRPGAPHAYLGARVPTKAERDAAAVPEGFVWDEEAVIPFTRVEFERYERDLRGAVRRGDLVERKLEHFEAWGRVQEERERKHVAALEAAAAAEALPGPTPGGDLPPIDGTEHTAEGTGTENTPVEAQADGTTTELVEPAGEKRKGRK